ncbi:MAG: TetR/AcrR family transcriptional regulator [Candidatus Marinimicrobia bacterium]|mgnify:FL=1|jgi:AcrR family transcriptional regulator|nr:TetR/AcrR family transcriptional regulator [Candidatus Neomarinimicrobiota bacterium]MBT3630515.1 TetR/AcrR family transcriptional regulator [Candidatus Neomarinimicrobiota bacterium]MBT3823409.1 TetR/AcrR family transcriptional regulator [Candidatus Neomarinimicrobiota bacterium]MBT4131744.1 TetR/AcrR family transcriptional regulator [Candidatus Neomarinimicrobiota bacterium]MBT4295412.1 TetR/AcrR family transcriptional regulator [Candidatus Neomarinimicrobiota bacterium]
MPHRILSEVQLPDFQDRPKKEGDILRTAEDLFMQFGYDRVSVEEICREAGVSKVTFYKYFKNKFGVLKEYMTIRLELGMEVFTRIRAADASLPDKMKALIAMKESAVSHFTPVFYKSLLSGDEQVQGFMHEWGANSMSAMREFLEDGQKSREIHPDYSIDFLLYVWNSLAEAARSEDMMAMYNDDMVKLSTDFLNFLCFGTTGPPQEVE